MSERSAPPPPPASLPGEGTPLELSQALLEANQVLEATFNATPLLIAHLDPQLRFVKVNAAYAAADGKAPSFFPGQGHFELFPHPENELLFEQVRDTGQAHTARARPFEYEHHPERGVTHCDWTLTPVKSGAGEVTGLVLTLSDVSERIRAHEALARNEERLDDAQRIAQTGSWEVDLASGRLCASPSMRELFEIDAGGPALEVQFLERVVEEDRATLNGAIAACTGHHQPVDFQHRIQRGDGSVRHFAVRVRHVKDSRSARLVGTSQDITERELAARELRLKDAAFESSINGVAFADLAGSITSVNPAFLRLWGLERPGEAIGRRVDSFWENPATAAGVLQHLFIDGSWFGRLIARTAGGAHPSMQVSAHLVRDSRGEPACMMASFVDVTLQERAAEQLAGELREKETLLREVHHRVKNNLQVISSLLSLQGAQATDPGVRAALGDSGARVQTMALVHERLYRSASLSSLDLGQHLSEVANMVFQTVQRQGLTLDCQLESLEVELEQALPLGLIVNELVSNACKHAFPQRVSGRVSVRLRRSAGGFALVVADDGAGLPAGFELERSASLGLKIVTRLARQIRATLSLEQVQGTSITVSTAGPSEEAEEQS